MREFPPITRIEVLDILDYGRVPLDGDKTASMFTGPTRPIYDITWRFTFTGRLLWGGGTSWAHVMFKKLTDYVEQRKPIAVVCTHITAANAVAGARMLTKQRFPIVCVPTDYEIEGLWPHKDADMFCVATEAMAETLRPRKVSGNAHAGSQGFPCEAGLGKNLTPPPYVKRWGFLRTRSSFWSWRAPICLSRT